MGDQKNQKTLEEDDEECRGVATLVAGYVAVPLSSSFPQNDVSLRAGVAWVKSVELTIALAGGCGMSLGRAGQGRSEGSRTCGNARPNNSCSGWRGVASKVQLEVDRSTTGCALT